MTVATDIAAQWNSVITDIGNTVTIYDPTITYNAEKDVNAYTLDGGTSATMITLQDVDGMTYASEVEGIEDRLALRALIKTTDTIDEETIIKKGTVYFRIAEGSLRKTIIDDTTIAQRAIMTKMLPQEVAKIA